MDNEKVLHFIAEKIEDLRLAIFYCHSKSVLKINNTVIYTSKVDHNGCISFFINRPQQLISQFEQEFPVGLNYFKKGRGYSLNIYGKARIINDPEDLAYETDLTKEEIDNAFTTHVLIKVKILKADFFDNNYEKKNVVMKKFWSVFYGLFDSVGAASRSYDFSRRPSLPHYSF